MICRLAHCFEQQIRGPLTSKTKASPRHTDYYNSTSECYTITTQGEQNLQLPLKKVLKRRSKVVVKPQVCQPPMPLFIVAKSAATISSSECCKQQLLEQKKYHRARGNTLLAFESTLQVHTFLVWIISH